MKKIRTSSKPGCTRGKLGEMINDDLAGEYQAIIAYTIYSQMLKGAGYTDIARELERHAA